MFLKVVAVLFILLITLTLVIRQIDLNTYKSSLADLIKSRTGFEVRFVGDIRWSLLPEIGFQAGKIVLNSNRSFTGQPIIQIAQSEIRIALLPLLQHKWEITVLKLDGLTLNLMKDAHGLPNWPDLSFPLPSLTSPHSGTVPVIDRFIPPSITIHTVTVNNTSVFWDNRQSGNRLEFNNINARLTGFASGKLAQITLSTAINGNTFEFPGALTVNTGLLLNEKLDRIEITHTDAVWNGASRYTQSQPLSARLTIPNGQYDMNREAFRLTGLLFETGAFRMKANISGHRRTVSPELQADIDIAPFNPVLTMKQWNLSLPVVRDNNAFTGLAMKFLLQATPDSASITGLDMTLDNSRISGSATIKDFSHPKFNFDIVVDAINLDCYRELQKTARISRNDIGTVFKVSSITQALDWLKILNVNGTILFRQLVVNQITMQNLRWSFASKQGLVKTAGNLNKP